MMVDYSRTLKRSAFVEIKLESQEYEQSYFASVIKIMNLDFHETESVQPEF